jgi:hypothetical protein
MSKPEEVIEIPKLKLRTDYVIPDCLKVWESKDQISPDYRIMMDNLNILIDNIAVSLNEGPEVADNVAKRIQSLDAVVKSLMDKVFISLSDRIAILEKMKFNMMYENQMKKMATSYIMAIKEQQEKSKNEQ